jgi:hypothetical protein
MGTTESVYADQPSVVEEITAREYVPNIPRNNETPQVTPSNRRRRNPHTISPSNVSVTQPQLQYPPRLNATKIQPTFLLNGMILGMSKSGKRTLLQRLEGKEPDFTITTRPRESENSDMSTVVNTRYQPPSNLPLFNEHIQLQVTATKRPSDVTNDENEYNFFVLLINPRHDRAKSQKYISKRLNDVLRIQGYQKISKSSSSSVSSAEQFKPLCISVLRNFCDQIHDVDEGAIVQITDLITWTMEVLQEYSPSIEPLLQCIDTSLLNCYGLSALHHFIYQSYVQHKQYIVQRELHRIDDAIAMSRQTAAILIIPYEKYLDNIERLIQGGTGSTASSGNPSSNNSASSVGRYQSSRNDDETATTATSSGINASVGRRKIIQLPTDATNKATSLHGNEVPLRNRAMSSGSSSTLPSMQQSFDNPKDALEAFLESDDDSNTGNVDIVAKVDDDSDDEDDFYLDDSDTRKNYGKMTEDSISKSEMQQQEKIIPNKDDNSDVNFTKIERNANSDLKSTVETNNDIHDEGEHCKNNSEPSSPLCTVDDSHVSLGVEFANQNSMTEFDSPEPQNIGDKTTIDEQCSNNIGSPPPQVKIDESTHILVVSNTLLDSSTNEDFHHDSTHDNTRAGKPKTKKDIDNDDDDDIFIEEYEVDNDKELTQVKQQKEQDRIDIVTNHVHHDTEESNINGPISYEQVAETIDSPTRDANLNVKSNNEKAAKTTQGNATAEINNSTSNIGISDEARIALELARQDFERMIRQEESERVEASHDLKKKKKDKHKKKSTDKDGKKSKRHD